MVRLVFSGIIGIFHGVDSIIANLKSALNFKFKWDMALFHKHFAIFTPLYNFHYCVSTF